MIKYRKNVLFSVKRFIDNIYGRRRRKSWREKGENYFDGVEVEMSFLLVIFNIMCNI